MLPKTCHSHIDGRLSAILLLVTSFVAHSDGSTHRAHALSRTMSGAPGMGPEMLVAALKRRGDPSAETNAHRMLLSINTASDFIRDVLDSAMSKTLQSTVSARENLFFSLQRVGNDSRRIFELVDRATNNVCDTARKAKTEINDAVHTSVDHLRESMKIVIRHLPDSNLNEATMDTVITSGQSRMEAVVENSGQRIVDAIQSYRTHFIHIDKDTGYVMVEPESSQEATDAVRRIVQASKSQIQEAIAGSSSFVLARIRELLAGSDSTIKLSTITPVNTTKTALQSEVIPITATEDVNMDDKTVFIGDIIATGPSTIVSMVTTATAFSVSTESPMVINTIGSSWSSSAHANAPTAAGSTISSPPTPDFSEGQTLATSNSSTSTMASAESTTVFTPVLNRRRVPHIRPIASPGVRVPL